MNNDIQMLRFAKAHGFKAICLVDKKGFIKAWDADGEITTDSMADLQAWMGY